ncbi:uncharacterized protein LOC120357826 isoform X2 [Solenopsis invicta]|uniref:uncharacterized protein LOC113002905 isoform X2 n=1 Tax=Solenopsis invicta TaxID=13686 RepID=UPI00193E1ABD|nr:uncharacterized protein LOC113002905 isoform X2 [Solenopsis invicta]XP_039305422.1 uncharacterized protein LOC120357826 isoform X2 [Solenopsis invicta]
MVRICFLCQKKAAKDGNFAMHKFPKEVSIRAQWLHACKLSDKDNVIHVHICSDHFVPSDYKNSIGLCSRKWLLKPGAVPSVNVPNPPAAELQFQSTSEIIMDETQSVPSIDVPPDFTSVSNVGELEFSTSKNVMDETRHENEQLHTPPKKRRFAEPRFISDIVSSDFSTPKRTRRVIAMVNKIHNKKRNLIHNLQKKNRELCKRITTLEEMVTHLRKEALISEEGGDALMV